VARVGYRYKVRRGDEVVATGHLSREQPLEIGDRIEIGGSGRDRAHNPALLGEYELDLVVQLVRDRASAQDVRNRWLTDDAPHDDRAHHGD
jgi:hypothetical protein